MDRQSIIEKIKALMAKANNGAATEAESIAFMNKALELLAKHNIEENELADKSEPVNVDVTSYHMMADLSWFGSLAGVVGEMYFCRISRSKRYQDGYKSLRNYYNFFGKEHNRMMAVSMFDYLMKTMHRLATAHSNNVKDQYEFKKGCSIRLAHRIYKINQDNKGTNSGEKTGLPALYNQELSIVDYFMKSLTLKTANKTTIKVGNSSFYEGSKAANTISLNNQIDHKKSGVLLIK